MPKTPPTDQVDTSDAPQTADTVSADSPSQGGSSNARTPAQWAEVFYPTSDRGRLHPDFWKHASAEQMHGWRAYEARTGKSVMLASDVYAAACEAVSGNDFRPHPAADYRSRS